MNLRPAVPTPAASPPRRRPGRPALRPARPGPRHRALLAVFGLTVLVLLGGCSIPGFPTGASASSATDSSDDGDAAGTGPSWFWYQQGERVETASPPAAARPASTTRTRAADPPATNPLPAGSASPECPKRLQYLTKTVRATGGAGRGTLYWSHVDDPRVIEYRVAAVLQDRPAGDNQPPQPWVTVAKPTTGCEEMTATVTGLISGRSYVFWLDAVISAYPNGRREPMIGRSNPFVVA